ncbi:hypothetical protein KEM48_008244 [Puccinia striiformis f. sp. tritici PST-130]|nr:hypothetical protein KEM48_008244 [Puccinia striiformis f. sp. tritici PST-130]
MFNVLEADLADLDEQYEEDEGDITQTQTKIAAEVLNEDSPASLPHINKSSPAKIRLKIKPINDLPTASNPSTQPSQP